jgi:hypothetical protein
MEKAASEKLTTWRMIAIGQRNITRYYFRKNAANARNVAGEM